jgi:hypothetical protein
MTDKLQPMDLVLNSKFKCEMRRLRIGKVLDYFETYRQEWREYVKEIAEGLTVEEPTYKPPKPNYKDAVATLLMVASTHLIAPEFQQSLTRCFVKVGLTQESERFLNHVPRQMGKVKLELDGDDSIAG